ncbi:MAG TPA: SGNH/GDSL hydrolase family protein [Phycisphaerales bacterium]|nr:SGNH/GDSL hydrolase family protein [Phycisphaerales bacterium]
MSPSRSNGVVAAILTPLSISLFAFQSALAQANSTYLALGDSYGFGNTTEASYTQSSNGDRGYVGLYADWLGTLHGTRPSVLNISITGDTTGSYFDTTETSRVYNTNYSGQSQMQRFNEAVADESAAGRTVTTVSCSFVGADLLELVQDPAFPTLPTGEQFTRLINTLNAAQVNYTNILTQVRTALPGADLILVGYPNPFRAYMDPAYDFVDIAVQGANLVVQQMASQFGGRYIDVYGAFHGSEGIYTEILLDPSVLPNPHPTEAGYEVIAGAMRVPGPGVAMVFVCVLVPGFQRSRRGLR